MAQDLVDIALVDDHALFRDGLRHILEAQPTFRIVGEAGDGNAAVQLVAATRPTVLLLDVQMRGADVVTTVRRVRVFLAGPSGLLLRDFPGVFPLLAPDCFSLKSF